MKKLIFHQRHSVDQGRIDRIEVLEGAVLADTQTTSKYTPLINIAETILVELVADEDWLEEAPDAA
jgi:hypothetical protein